MKTEGKAHSRCYQAIVASVFALGLAAMPNLSHAATVSYNEAISGDLNGSQTFTFDVGANTITGTMSYDGFTYDFDY
jgi:hypothetical protein